LGKPAKSHERTVAIKSSKALLREAHPSEEAVEVLAVAGDFGRAATLSFISAPQRSFLFGYGSPPPGLCV